MITFDQKLIEYCNQWQPGGWPVGNLLLSLAALVLCVLLVGIVGIERERSGKMVGSRTISLICLGSTLFCLMSPNVFNADNSRVVAQIVSGIGFIGAGIIFKNGDEVKGLTTAATIWASASIGALVGMGMFIEAAIGTIAVLFVNITFKFLKPKNKNNDINKS